MPNRGFMIGSEQLQGNINRVNAIKAVGANVTRWQFVNHLAEDVTPAGYLGWVQDRIDNLKLTISSTSGVNFIIDLHTLPGGLKTNILGQSRHRVIAEDLYRRTFKDAWSMISNNFKNEPRVISYDIANEPHTAKKRWRKLARTVIKSFRNAGDDKFCWVSQPFGNPDALIRPIDTSNTGYTLHWYLPIGTSSQGLDPNATQGVVFNGIATPAMTRLNRIKKHYQGHRVLIGEIGCSRASGYPNVDNRIKYFDEFLGKFNEFGWDWCIHAWEECHVWNVHGRWELLGDNVCGWSGSDVNNAPMQKVKMRLAE